MNSANAKPKYRKTKPRHSARLTRAEQTKNLLKEYEKQRAETLIEIFKVERNLLGTR